MTLFGPHSFNVTSQSVPYLKERHILESKIKQYPFTSHVMLAQFCLCTEVVCFLFVPQFYCVRAAVYFKYTRSLESIQAVAFVAGRVLPGEGTVVLHFTYVLGLTYLLLDFKNLAYSYLWRQKITNPVSEGRLKRKINLGSF